MKRYVLVLQLWSFITFTIGNSSDDQIELPPQNALVAWALLTLILLILNDLEPNGDISTALAALIFLSVTLLYGEKLWKRLEQAVGK